MAWTIEYRPEAIKDLRKLDRTIRAEILAYLDERIASAEHPRLFGKALRHEKLGLWRFRHRNYRIICEMQDIRQTILVIGVGHRRDVYD